MKPFRAAGLRFAACGLVLAAAGCAAGSAAPKAAASRQSLQSWIGKTEKELIREVGDPDNSITVQSGETYDEYREGELSTRNNSGCVTTFHVDSNGVIFNVDWKGPGCLDAPSPASK